jgi:hypothetical protein
MQRYTLDMTSRLLHVAKSLSMGTGNNAFACRLGGRCQKSAESLGNSIDYRQFFARVVTEFHVYNPWSTRLAFLGPSVVQSL